MFLKFYIFKFAFFKICHEIHWISWNPPDFIMKYGGFHNGIRRISWCQMSQGPMVLFLFIVLLVSGWNKAKKNPTALKHAKLRASVIIFFILFLWTYLCHVRRQLTIMTLCHCSPTLNQLSNFQILGIHTMALVAPKSVHGHLTS